jgi:anti-anti-sigma factor
MQIDISVEKEVAVTSVNGRLDSISSHKLDEHLAAIAPDARAVLLDFAGLTYISSAGLRVVLKAAKLARATGASLAVCGLSPQVHEVFDVSGFSTLIPVHADRAAALLALS